MSRLIVLLPYAHLLAGSAAGFLSGLAYNKISNRRDLLITAADEERLKKILEHHSLTKHGIPTSDNLILKNNYLISYNKKTKVPNWTMEHLTSENIYDGSSAIVRGKKKNFRVDETIPISSRSTDEDYTNSGYDRGHLACAENHKYSLEAYNETFVFSNVAPQVNKLNQGSWHRLEERVRTLVSQYGSVYVFSGTLYLPSEIDPEVEKQLPQEKKRRKNRNQTEKENQSKRKKFVIYEVIGKNNVAVPTHFFKVIICEAGNGTYDMESYIMPNEPVKHEKNLSEFMTSREEIEKHSGLNIFDKLPSNKLRSENGKKDRISNQHENTNLKGTANQENEATNQPTNIRNISDELEELQLRGIEDLSSDVSTRSL